MSTLGKQVMARLRQWAHNGSDAVIIQAIDSYQLLTVQSGQSRACLDFFDIDRYSATLRILSVYTSANAAIDNTMMRSALNAYAAEMARQLSYLEEPLQTLEIDADECWVQLRSSPPYREGQELFYWEVFVRLDDQAMATLARYHWAPGMIERELVPYPATFALLARITDSIHAALSTPLA